jgi:hypothetical protein
MCSESLQCGTSAGQTLFATEHKNCTGPELDQWNARQWTYKGPMQTDWPASGDPANPKSNQLLAALPHSDWQRWRPHLEHVDLPFGVVLDESGMAQSHAYFPTSAIVSLFNTGESGASAETAVVGNESFVGAALLLGGGSTTGVARCKSPAKGFRIGARGLKVARRR